MEHLKSHLNYIGLVAAWFIFLSLIFFQPIQQHVISPLAHTFMPLHSLENDPKGRHEVFGFAPYWTFNNLDAVDFDTLTTLAYFDVKVDKEGNMKKDDIGYQTFISPKATELFKKAHAHGTRVVLTLTQMDNATIEAFMSNPDAQENLINNSVELVKRRGIDGINVDFEYVGNPGSVQRNAFSQFVTRLTAKMHSEIPASKVTVSVYASAIKDPKIYDIAALAQSSDGIFMMAYDYAVSGSDHAIPTAPLRGYKAGKYWYDVETAVEDFLAYMPADKLILGVPWYGYEYPITEPKVKAETLSRYYGRSEVHTYSTAEAQIRPDMPGVDKFVTGWDEYGQVGWKAYRLSRSGTWRMLFMEDNRSLGMKYDFAKEKKLLGVGMWALGFEKNSTELWTLLRQKFGQKLADITISQKPIYETL
jgi:spore germination protein YaaH